MCENKLHIEQKTLDGLNNIFNAGNMGWGNRHARTKVSATHFRRTDFPTLDILVFLPNFHRTGKFCPPPPLQPGNFPMARVVDF
jgi:hypothetical protein